MKIYVFKNHYYIGNDLSEDLKAQAQLQDIEIPDGKQIKVVDYQVEFVDEFEMEVL